MSKESMPARLPPNATPLAELFGIQRRRHLALSRVETRLSFLQQGEWRAHGAVVREDGPARLGLSLPPLGLAQQQCRKESVKFKV